MDVVAIYTRSITNNFYQIYPYNRFLANQSPIKYCGNITVLYKFYLPSTHSTDLQLNNVVFVLVHSSLPVGTIQTAYV